MVKNGWNRRLKAPQRLININSTRNINSNSNSVLLVGGHYEHGRLERQIRAISTSVDMLFKERLSILQWRTLATSFANSINKMSLEVNGIISDLENLDILTQNRLKLGRNYERSLIEPVELKKQLENNYRI